MFKLQFENFKSEENIYILLDKQRFIVCFFQFVQCYENIVVKFFELDCKDYLFMILICLE